MATIPKPQNPDHICWLFGADCVRLDDVKKRLTQEELDYLLFCMQKKIYPEKSKIIKKALPRPYLTLKEKGVPCTVEGMRLYWTSMHNLKGEFTPSRIATVIQSGAYYGTSVHVRFSPRTTWYLRNVHGYLLRSREEVYVHGEIVAVPTELLDSLC